MGRQDSHGKRYKIVWPRFIASLCVVALVVFGVRFAVGRIGSDADVKADGRVEVPAADIPDASSEPDTPSAPEPVTIDIRCIGDLMAHQTQLDSAQTGADGGYNFDKWFTEIKPYLGDSADLMLANVETTFKGEPPYTGYPDFNSPDAYADTIINYIGTDIACFANNHMLDGGYDRLMRGVQYFRDGGAFTTGARFEGEDRFTIVDVKGIKVGIVNYCYETPQNGGKRTLQSGILNDTNLYAINHFGYEDLDGDLAEVKEQMAQCRESGAQIVIAFFHWGEEYQNSANPYQRRIAEYLANNGADVVFGSHPHVVQEVDSFTVDDRNGGAKTVPVFYSLGNFISNQRRETLDNKYTENGMVGVVRFTWSFEDNAPTDVQFGFIPTWVDRYKSASGWEYSVVPLVGDFENCESFAVSGHLDYARSALDYMKQLCGEDRIWN